MKEATNNVAVRLLAKYANCYKIQFLIKSEEKNIYYVSPIQKTNKIINHLASTESKSIKRTLASVLYWKKFIWDSAEARIKKHFCFDLYNQKFKIKMMA